jgi:putative tricarboxylic transport membrane protein
MGLFGLAEVLDHAATPGRAEVLRGRITQLWPTAADWQRAWRPIVRGTGIGFLCGLLPGPNATIASIVSYGVERRVGRYPEQFGRGAIEGVAGPESANNAAAVLRHNLVRSRFATCRARLTGPRVVGLTGSRRLQVAPSWQP